MTTLAALILFLVGIWSSLRIFKRFLNPLSLYSTIWFLLVFFYELKLIRYPELSLQTWLVILAGFFSFYMGIIIYYNSNYKFILHTNKNILIQPDSDLFAQKGYYLRIVIIVTGIIGLVGAIQHWLVLLEEYGSLANIILSANIIYRERIEGELTGVIPYISTLSIVSLFFASIYSAYRGKLSILLIIPSVGIILKDLALVGRTSMLMMMMIFITVYIFYKSLKLHNQTIKKFNKKTILGVVIIMALLLVSASLVKVYRAGLEEYKASTRTLRQFESGIIFSPSVYLYMSSHIGVLDKYFRKDVEEVNFGENTFMPIYRMLYKLETVKKPQFYQQGYYIPMWTNTGTYLRELHADFGYAGIFLVPFLLGFILSQLWYSLKSNFSITKFILLIYLNLIVFYSFLTNVTRFGNWLISLFITIFLAYSVEKYIRRKWKVKRQVS